MVHVIAGESDCLHVRSERALSGRVHHVIKYVRGVNVAIRGVNVAIRGVSLADP